MEQNFQLRYECCSYLSIQKLIKITDFTERKCTEVLTHLIS